MAIIKLGPVVADARGSVGGTVFSRNAAGAYMKQRTVPTYPGSAKQVARAALLSTIIDDWKNTLGNAPRAAWNALAAITKLPNKLGEMFTPSGMNLFVKANFMLDLTGQAHITAPPVAAIAPAMTLTLDHENGVGIVVTSIGNWDTTPATRVLGQFSPNLPLSTFYYKGPWTNIWGADGTTFDALPLTICGSALLQAHSRKFFRYRAVHDDGMVSAPAIFSAEVGPTP